MSTKKIAIGVSLAIVLAAGWIGGGIYAQKKFQAEAKAFADGMSSNVGITVKGLKQDSGFLSSSGQFTINISDASSDLDFSFDLAATYKASHLLLPDSVTRFDWDLKLAGDASKEITRLFGDSARIDGVAKISYGGNFTSSIAIPKLAAREDGVVFEFGPTAGAISGSKNKLSFDVVTNRMVVRTSDDALDMKQIKYQSELTNIAAGLGSAQFTIDELSTKDVVASGISLKASSTQRADRIDMSLMPSVRSVSYSGVTVKDTSLEIMFKDLNAKSVETLSKVFNNASPTNLTAAEKALAQDALRELIYQGFSVGITKIAAAAKEGSVDGSVSLELLKSASNKPSDFNLVKQLVSSGQLTVKAVDEQYKGMALMFGVAQETPEGLKAGYELSGGKLKFNGKTMDISDELSNVQSMIVKVLKDDFLDLASLKQASLSKNDSNDEAKNNEAQAIADAAPKQEVAKESNTEELKPQESKAYPTAQDCDDLGDCLIASLRAAANDDIDSVRAAATRIDAMSKPDLGNRTVGRKLNTEGLEALKRGDNNAAIQAFTQSIKENPKDVEVVGNLGFTYVQAGQADEAVEVLADAILLDPRRTSTWTPLGEALALAGYPEEAVACLWIGYQWSNNRDKSLAYYASQAEKQKNTKPALAQAYESVLNWIAGNKAEFKSLGK